MPNDTIHGNTAFQAEPGSFREQNGGQQSIIYTADSSTLSTQLHNKDTVQALITTPA
jgi:hypothetical protein